MSSRIQQGSLNIDSINHVELVRKARGAEMPESFWTDPLMYQGGSDAFIGPCDNIEFASDEWGIDFEGEVAVVTGDVPMGASVAEAQESNKCRRQYAHVFS